MSDRWVDVPSLEDRLDDVRAVMDAAGSEHAALVGMSEGGPMSILFAATFRERVRSLTLFGTFATFTRTDDHPWMPTADERAARERLVDETVLYTDIVDSTARASSLGDADWIPTPRSSRPCRRPRDQPSSWRAREVDG